MVFRKKKEETVTGREDLNLPEVFGSPKKYSLKSFVKKTDRMIVGP